MDFPFFSELSRGGRIGLALGIVAIIGFTVATVLWIADRPQGVLFSELETADAGRVVNELDRQKLDYQLADEGSTILVPEEEVHETRLKLMSSGVSLAGGVGFEIFDDVGFGMTEFAQRINYQRALEGELTRTIIALDSVKYARVHVVMPEGGLFRNQQDDASAAVTLFLRDGQAPSRGQISGVQRLVAAAVPQLKAEQVTVSNQSGITLSQSEDMGSGGAAMSGRLQRKMEVETYFVDKLDEILAQAFGPNQAMVAVDVVLDFNESTITTERVIPVAGKNDGVVRRRESRRGQDGSEGRIGTGDSQLTTEVEYQHGKSVAQTVEHPGRIQRISVGVVVPAGTVDERMLEIQELVARIVGFDESRGDAIGVYSISAPGISENGNVGELATVPPRFSEPAPVARVTAAKGVDTGVNFYLMIAVAVGVLLVVALAMTSRRQVTVAPSDRLSGTEREQLLREVQGWIAGGDRHNENPSGERT